MQTKPLKLSAVPTYLLSDESKLLPRVVGWRYSWNDGETTDVFFDADISHTSIMAKET
ncbi:hypothetical protein OS190_18390 [Sulfitobacter sp. F26204]|uniref:hypothetical protein n=1 Tax=Sulfitobacter sp. F26204 TaxID=2996014 RepID=UPI00225E0E79|nr:hypothetical protein [Sulfitobacter sp. F26204]MCX7561537.1 hypothetical protein [Sulfitobacter sp. F26204]